VAIEIDSDLSKVTVAGFENHGGRTWLGEDVRPWGKVLAGHGNNDRDRTEGVAYRNLIGTYLHGPLLPKNHRLADSLIVQALQRQGSPDISLEPLEDDLEAAAHRDALEAALSAR
jgi:CobQ-like glutamine amidotransferase family enzyme